MAELSSHVNGSGNVTILIVGDGNVVNGDRTLGLCPWERFVRSDLTSELEILDPRYEAVPVVGRDGDLAYLKEWLGGGGIAITAVIGQGGAGKTRLAVEFLKALPEGWQGGFFEGFDVRWFEQAGCRFVWERNTVVVVDYAAIHGQMLAQWFERLAQPPAPKHALRILLLERHGDEGGGWYKELTDSTSHGRDAWKLFRPKAPRTITPLDSLQDRRRVLASGLSRLAGFDAVSGGQAARVLRELPGLHDEDFKRQLERIEWADPLLLLMAAVAASHNGVPHALSLNREEVARDVAARDAARLRKGVLSPAAKRGLVHLYACVILCGSLPWAECVAVAKAEFQELGLDYPGGPGQAVADLARLIGADRAFSRLKPDLLAEAFLLEVGTKTETVLRMAHLAEKRKAVAQMLIFTARDFGASDDWPVEWLRKIVEKGEAEIDVLIEIEAALPVQTLVMRQLALAVGKMLVAWARRGLDADGTLGSAGRLARYLNNCSLCETAAGDREGALASIREAAGLYRELHGANPDAFASDLAMSLNNLSTCESEVGDRTGALASIREAVVMLRELHGANPDAFASDLASSLNNLSNRQSELGDRVGALASIREAVAIRRKLHGANPDAFASDLAMSLNNLSIRQSGVGDREGALVSIREAVAIRRKLHGANPDAFASDLAMSLNNLSIRQSGVGDREGALASIIEAVGIRRKLHGANPDAFASDLASSLNNLSIRQSAVGDREGALASIREAVALYRKLHGANPDAFASDLAMSLNSLSNRQSAVGDRTGALASIRESVAIRRKLHGANSDAFASDLATSLNNLSHRQSAVGDREGALASIREAVAIHRKLHGASPDAFVSDLAHSLSFLGDRLDENEVKVEARDAAEESLRVLRPDFERTPKGFRGFEKATVGDYKRRSEELGLEVDEELVGVYAGLFEEEGEVGEV